ncbi:FAD-dependent oxidoreductase, partial [Staphylococcus warneri]|uniref:FAD-dependent oxidoreductase n=1 Tax=Staphylococcus warneri TaxID=1292 RepID=UPI0030C31E93
HYDNKKIEQQYQFLRQHFASVERLSPTDVQHMSNGAITSKHTNGIYMPEDNQINANRYTKGLLKSLSNRHIDRIYQTTVTHIESITEGYRG